MKNEKLLKVIDEAVATSNTSIEALDKIIKWKKENEDLIGVHFSIYPTSEDETVDKEKVAKSFITMIRCSANGDTEELNVL
jgi:hypothetical protein